MDKEFFIQRYVIEGKSYTEIAKELGWNKSSIKYYMRKFEIPIDNIKQRQKEKTLRGVQHPMFGKPGTLTGKVHSEETKEKIALAHRGVKEKPVTEKARAHMSEAQRKRPRKPDNERKTPLYRGIRVLPEYKTWRTQVYERDNFICQNCGTRGNTLNADHIQSLAEIVRRNHIMTILDAIACVELWDISNGRTLCVQCHRQTKTYGGGSKPR